MGSDDLRSNLETILRRENDRDSSPTDGPHYRATRDAIAVNSPRKPQWITTLVAIAVGAIVVAMFVTRTNQRRTDVTFPMRHEEESYDDTESADPLFQPFD